jgi:hypothetical protein
VLLPSSRSSLSSSPLLLPLLFLHLLLHCSLSLPSLLRQGQAGRGGGARERTEEVVRAAGSGGGGGWRVGRRWRRHG